MDIDLTALSGDELDALWARVVAEQERRRRLIDLPAQVEQMTRQYLDARDGTHPTEQAETLADVAAWPVWVQPTGAHDAYPAGRIIQHGGTLWRSLIAALLEIEDSPLESIDVEGAQDRPSMHLLAGWITSRVGVPVRFHDSGGIHITRVDLTFASGRVRISRPLDSAAATISRAGRPDQRMNLPPRTTTDCLMEELRRLDADEVYADALQHAVAAL